MEGKHIELDAARLYSILPPYSGLFRTPPFVHDGPVIPAIGFW